MRILIKKGRKESRPINKWLMITVAILVTAIALAYFVSVSVNNAKTQQQISTLNLECAGYGQQLTSAAASNLDTPACQNQNGSKLPSCGAVFYCYYSAAACEKAGETNTSVLSCVCDALRSNEVLAANQGVCQRLS